jgi:arsenate reductase (thioredoxin)
VSADATAPSIRPVVLYACIHNSGRSVAAQVLTERYAHGAVTVRSAGSEPGTAVNPVVAQVLAERGLSTVSHTPALLDHELVQGADVVVTMGCGETCPVFPGKRYEDWPVTDPKDQDLSTVRAIVHDIDRRVRGLLTELGVTMADGSAADASSSASARESPTSQARQR